MRPVAIMMGSACALLSSLVVVGSGSSARAAEEAGLIDLF
jgi:hypothetical protein